MGAKTLPEKDEKQVNNKKEHEPENKSKKKRRAKKERIRIFPIWLRVIVIFFLAIIALVCGLMFGYSVMGDGTATEVFKVETWQHIVDIVTKE